MVKIFLLNFYFEKQISTQTSFLPPELQNPVPKLISWLIADVPSPQHWAVTLPLFLTPLFVLLTINSSLTSSECFTSSTFKSLHFIHLWICEKKKLLLEINFQFCFSNENPLGSLGNLRKTSLVWCLQRAACPFIVVMATSDSVVADVANIKYSRALKRYTTLEYLLS